VVSFESTGVLHEHGRHDATLGAFGAGESYGTLNALRDGAGRRSRPCLRERVEADNGTAHVTKPANG
jgi:hypothetical protein